MEKKLLQVKNRSAYSTHFQFQFPLTSSFTLNLVTHFMLIDYPSSKRDIKPTGFTLSLVQDLKYKSSSNEVFLPDSDFIGHGICIVVPGSSGIPKWIRKQREGYQITMDLPQKNDFAHTFSENESGDEALNESDDLFEAESSISTELECQLSLHDGYGFSPLCVQPLSFRTTCKCYHDGGASEQMWVIFYPKAAILESCHTNPSMFLGALFMALAIILRCQNLVTLPGSTCNYAFLKFSMSVCAPDKANAG
ncbi:hypothetical protein CK203_065331 [Vitis vinifera]|uniref:Uncharacterized protein n=1 Tax=Vitis vinifera TaxID=29760 RepID=A0A438FNR2_VITVI|nr:hypothetical protein CK203_065331 [Vitis vinifera]